MVAIEKECLGGKFEHISGADPGFVVKGGVSMRGVWGPLKVPSGSQTEPL